MSTTQRITALVATLLVAAPLIAASPHTACIDCPTPPPCAADGACYPKRQTWGYYHTRWNRWPGDYDEAPTPADERSRLPETEVPEPEVEDREAPRPTAEPQPEPAEGAPEGDAEGEGARGIDLPPLPGLPDLPGPAEEAPSEQPNDTQDPVPPLPDFRGLTPPGVAPPPTGPPAPGGRQQQPQRQGARSEDRPPALPPGLAGTLPVDRSSYSGSPVVTRLPSPRGPTDAPPVPPAHFAGPLR